MALRYTAAALSLAVVTAVAGAAAAPADRPQPVPLYGSYNTFLDHSKQTFNGQPRASEPSTQAASFTTNCDASGCIAHWLLVDKLQDNPSWPDCRCSSPVWDPDFR